MQQPTTKSNYKRLNSRKNTAITRQTTLCSKLPSQNIFKEIQPPLPPPPPPFPTNEKNRKKRDLHELKNLGESLGLSHIRAVAPWLGFSQWSELIRMVPSSWSEKKCRSVELSYSPDVHFWITFGLTPLPKLFSNPPWPFFISSSADVRRPTTRPSCPRPGLWPCGAGEGSPRRRRSPRQQEGPPRKLVFLGGG